jgi:ADP-ribose pyrophosphatase YjhB (NUDIX family)
MMKSCYVGVKGIVKVGDSVLVLKKRKPELAYWDIPGGRIEDSESLEDTLRRELREELPELTEYTIVDVVSAYRLPFDPEGDVGLVFVFFLVRATSRDIGMLSEHEGFEWVTMETLPSLKESEYEIQPRHYEALTRALHIS